MARKKSNLAVAYKADQTREGAFFDQLMKTAGMDKMPAATDAEIAVIGGILMDSDAINQVPFLTEMDFYIEKNRTVFKAMLKLKQANTPIDIVTLSTQLHRDGKIMDEGTKDPKQLLTHLSPIEISKLMDKSASAANIKAHAYILVDMRYRRQTIHQAFSLYKSAFNPGNDIYDLRDKAQRSMITAPVVDLFRYRTAAQTMEEARHQPRLRKLMGNMVFEGDVCILFGDNGTGKSIFCVQLAQAIASGTAVFPFLENEMGPQKVGHYDFELKDKPFFRRYSNGEGDELRYFQFHENFIRPDFNPEFEDFSEDLDAEIFNKIATGVAVHELKVVILDNVTYLSGGDLADAKVATKIMKSLLRMSKKLGVTVIALAHTPKIPVGEFLSKNHLGGSKQFSNLVDSIIGIGRSTFDRNIKYLKSLKSRSDEITFDESKVILTNIVKEDGIYLKHEFIEFDEEANHLTKLDKSDLEDVKEKAIEMYKEYGLSSRKIKQKLQLNQSHTTINKWLREYREQQQLLKQAEQVADDSPHFLDENHPLNKRNDKDLPF